jgi:hypothetical protein
MYRSFKICQKLLAKSLDGFDALCLLSKQKNTYRVIQEQRLTFCEVIVFVLGGALMTTCLVPNGYRDRLVWICRTDSNRVLFVGLVQERRLHAKGGYTRRILDAAARIKKFKDQLRRRTTRGLRIRVAKCTEVDGGIFELSLRTVTNLSFRCNEVVI